MLHLHNLAPMHTLPLTTLSLLAPTLAGVGVVVGLVSGVTSGVGLCLSAAAGVLVAVPVSWGVARALAGPEQEGDET